MWNPGTAFGGHPAGIGPYGPTDKGGNMEHSDGLTRRRMLQLTGIGSLAAGVAAFAGCNQEDVPSEPEQKGLTIETLDPSGSVAITQHFVERLDTLEGKTIAFVTNDDWESERTFPLLEKILKEKYAGITIIREDNFARGMNDITKDNNGIAEVMLQMNVDGAILGNAG